ncbi:MAG: trp operon repressor [Cellvibrionaceae bacterium]|nr:trp operon repressor [Cellvibrionaceae bacterium]
MPKKMLTKILCQLSDPAEMESFIEYLFTEKELKELGNRINIFKMLIQNTPQREIADRLGVGIATVTRGAQALKHDKQQLLERVL